MPVARGRCCGSLGLLSRMNKKGYIAALGYGALGLALGACGTYFTIKAKERKLGGIPGQVLITEDALLADARKRALDAYRHQSKPVAIYALSEELDALKKAKDHGGTPWTEKWELSADMALVNGRLARLYDETGQTNESASCVEEALRNAKESGAFVDPSITNRAGLLHYITTDDHVKERLKEW